MKISIKKVKIILTYLFSFLTLISTGYLIYNISLLNNIENFLRMVANILLCLIFLTFVIFFIKSNKVRKHKMIVIVGIVSILYSSLLYFIAFNINKVYSSISSITNNFTTTSISLVSLSTNPVTDIKEINNGKIGLLSDESKNEIAMSIVKNKALKTDNLVKMDGYTDLIDALYDKKIDYAFLPTNYAIMFQNIESYATISTDTKIIYTEEKKVKTNVSKNHKLDKPFTVLIMGVDSEFENIANSSFNGDALMVLTFNPNTLSTTILSIPRDTYVPISCFSGNRKNKITHAAWYGEDCMIETIENFMNISIDYYVKINFKGVVKLVDALGGIDVDVPMSFCEQDSNRNFDNLICLDKGYQHVNGEQALALARHRKTINDFIRGQNQQLVIRGLMNSAKGINSLDTIYSLLDTVSNNMETNMSTNEILSLYNIAKDIMVKSKDTNIDELLNMQRLYINGYDAYIYDYSQINGQGTGMTLYDFVPYSGSIKEISDAMKLNLGLIEDIPIKEFSFSVDDPYEENVIGRDNYNGDNVSLLPDFIGDDESVATSYGNKKGINVNVNYVTSSNSNYTIGQIIDQDLPEGMDLDYISSAGLTITVVEKIEKDDDDDDDDKKVNCSLEENKDHKKCIIPDFIGDYYSTFEIWQKANNYSYRVKVNEIKPDDAKYDSSKRGLIIEQKASYDNIYDLIGNTIEITYISDEVLDEDNNGEDDNNEPDIDEDDETA